MMRLIISATFVLMLVVTVRAELVELSISNATCAVDTCGARVVSYRVEGQELLWMPNASCEFPQADEWVHGGIPVAWPWFGRIGHADENIHGYAWRSNFSVKERKRDRVVFILNTEAAQLEYTVSLDPTLTLQMRTVNLSLFDLPVGAAFHPYFRVGERDAAFVEGVDPAPILVTNAVDRSVRFGKVEAKRTYLLRDRIERRLLRITAFGSTGVNVWNPGAEKNCPGKIPGDEWRRFIAVEPFVMGDNRFLVLKPKEEFVLRMVVARNPDPHDD